MTLCELLNQELPPETKRTTLLTGILYWVHVRCRRGHWEEVREAKHLLEDITDCSYWPPH